MSSSTDNRCEIRTAGAIILQISHGYTIQEENDPFIELAERTMNQFSLSTASGGFLANLIPIRRSLLTLEFATFLRSSII